MAPIGGVPIPPSRAVEIPNQIQLAMYHNHLINYKVLHLVYVVSIDTTIPKKNLMKKYPYHMNWHMFSNLVNHYDLCTLGQKPTTWSMVPRVKL